jgi:hypothetical protein
MFTHRFHKSRVQSLQFARAVRGNAVEHVILSRKIDEIKVFRV